MEESDARTQLFQLNHQFENKEQYGSRLFKQCCQKNVKPADSKYIPERTLEAGMQRH